MILKLIIFYLCIHMSINTLACIMTAAVSITREKLDSALDDTTNFLFIKTIVTAGLWTLFYYLNN